METNPINWRDAEKEKPKVEEKDLLIWYADEHCEISQYYKGGFYSPGGYRYQTVTHFAEINEP